jgi:hypothetical protein
VRPLYAKTSVPNLDIDNEIFALDSTSVSIYLMDKAYVDFEALCRMQTIGAFFVTRTKDTMKYEVVEQNYNIDETCGLRSDKTVVLTSAKSKKLYPEKWIKQNPTIKKFWGHSQNAVSIQLWVAIIAYLLVAYLKHTLKCDLSVYQIMQILSVSAFDRTPIRKLLTNFKSNQNVKELQYTLFDKC